MRFLFLFSIGVLAVFWDFYSGRIPNVLIGAGLLAALGWQWSANGPPGTGNFLAGALLPLLVLGVLHYFKMMGAGDLTVTESEVYLLFISDCCGIFTDSSYQISHFM